MPMFVVLQMIVYAERLPSGLDYLVSALAAWKGAMRSAYCPLCMRTHADFLLRRSMSSSDRGGVKG